MKEAAKSTGTVPRFSPGGLSIPTPGGGRPARPGDSPRGLLQGAGEGGVVVRVVVQGVVPRGRRLHAGVRGLAAQGVLQRLIKGCFATGPALTFFKLLEKEKDTQITWSDSERPRVSIARTPGLEVSLWKAVEDGVKPICARARLPGCESQRCLLPAV